MNTLRLLNGLYLLGGLTLVTAAALKIIARKILYLWTIFNVVALAVLHHALVLRRERRFQPCLEPPTSPLLTLPPELRLMIWHYVLPDEVTLSKAHPRPDVPPIALTCHQAWFEIMPMYICETLLFCEVRDTHGAFVVATWRRLVELIALGKVNVTEDHLPFVGITFDGDLSWSNLISWAQAAHRLDLGFAFPTDFAMGPDEDDILSVLRIACRLKSLPWQEVKNVLQELSLARGDRWQKRAATADGAT